jgi:asparagine synthase (glutamine-hydrolysing)
VLYKRQKFAFMAPPAHTDAAKRRRLDALLERFLSFEAVAAAGLFDPGRTGAFVDGYRREQDPNSLVRFDAVVNHLLCLHILSEQYVEGAGPVPEPSLSQATASVA